TRRQIDVGRETYPVARRRHRVAQEGHFRRRVVHRVAFLPEPGDSATASPSFRIGRWARSSAGEHYVDIVGVTGSIPVALNIPRRAPLPFQANARADRVGGFVRGEARLVL